jgi:prevent-host-death family protein
MAAKYNLYEAKTQLSALVERAHAGEEILIAKSGKTLAKLVAAQEGGAPREPAGALRLKRIAPDFDAPLPDEIQKGFEGG